MVGLFVFLLMSSKNSLHILHINPYQRNDWQAFSSILWVVFSPLNVSLSGWLLLLLVLLVSNLRNHWQTQSYEDLLLCFLPIFIVFTFTFSSWIYFGL
jgi:hypothetical protein